MTRPWTPGRNGSRPPGLIHPHFQGVLRFPIANWPRLRLKWDRQLAHDWTRCTGLGGRIRWAIKALLLVPSPLCAVAEVVSSPRIKGARNRLMALIGLTSIRLYRARRMLSLLRGYDPERLLHRWNRIDLP